jgi:hypothetical protein
VGLFLEIVTAEVAKIERIGVPEVKAYGKGTK